MQKIEKEERRKMQTRSFNIGHNVFTLLRVLFRWNLSEIFVYIKKCFA